MKICCPSISEQNDIVAFCGKQNLTYGALIESAGSAVRLLQERRTALISAAVTGKIDVRAWQPQVSLSPESNLPT
jgi:type I restriction enzyme S subunit